MEVTWKQGQNKTVFESDEEILEAKEGGRVEFKESDIVINAPQIIWPDGQMKLREDNEITENTSYTGGQILEINEEDMTVTFIAHRGWGKLPCMCNVFPYQGVLEDEQEGCSPSQEKEKEGRSS